jgi:hypothetical protein
MAMALHWALHKGRPNGDGTALEAGRSFLMQDARCAIFVYICFGVFKLPLLDKKRPKTLDVFVLSFSPDFFVFLFF